MNMASKPIDKTLKQQSCLLCFDGSIFWGCIISIIQSILIWSYLVTLLISLNILALLAYDDIYLIGIYTYNRIHILNQFVISLVFLPVSVFGSVKWQICANQWVPSINEDKTQRFWCQWLEGATVGILLRCSIIFIFCTFNAPHCLISLPSWRVMIPNWEKRLFEARKTMMVPWQRKNDRRPTHHIVT